jgi:hypothetical protein
MVQRQGGLTAPQRRSHPGEPGGTGVRQKGRIRGGIEDGMKGGQSDAGLPFGIFTKIYMKMRK